jgi:CO/xanthine dehydrogenase Mo-binding subunit
VKEVFFSVGNPSGRVDGVEKVTGQAKYTGDIALSGLLEGRVLRSPFPHAAIESIDASKAEALAGVAAVLTRDDLNDINPYYGHCLRDRPLIAIDRVRYVVSRLPSSRRKAAISPTKPCRKSTSVIENCRASPP